MSCIIARLPLSFSVQWVKVNGILYKRPCSVVVGITKEIMPQFGGLEAIYVFV